MALLDSAHRVSAARQERTATKSGIHPSICLVSGFGFIVAMALLVHVTMAALL
ncbi:hypothetical protein [Brevundimonas subvibrioides]|uniref:Uncharacterized protein n=1 Tax=Brevundimonas subvibrioides (strain ATCC 15264 / DSM 4735 / LMG 14903 / NBRC 16000 / CB 81) TaxID=633149 RepID=D9QF21_BRESC|nr:hypothetical protein [Brevundimonas subvibrioides]ADL00506.1 hypothetical protein Bresu_1194 [Brevundimonas subvibrioides ATCC 15264]